MSDKPANVVFVFSDQHSYDFIGCAGRRDVMTPNIDAFAKQGVRFEHAVANCPICTPCRGMLISGQHPLYNGAYRNDARLKTADEIGPGIGEVLRDAGYKMGYVGKWHLLGGERDRPIPRGKERHGFDDLFLSNNCHVNYEPGIAYYWTHDTDEKVHFNDWEARGQTNQALDFLDRQTADEPFCMFVSWHPPHAHGGGNNKEYGNCDCPDEFKNLYDPETIELRPQVQDTPEMRKKFVGYSGMCSEVDAYFGELLAKLDEKGLAENTLVVFTADHGEVFGAYNGQVCKNVPEDISARVPMVMRFPGVIPESRVSELLIGLIDMPATLLGLLGLDVPEHFHGRDLSKAIIEGDDDAVDSQPLFAFWPSWRGVYTKRYVYAVENFERDRDLTKRIPWTLPGRGYVRSYNVLYDREQDPHMMSNLFNSVEHLEIGIELAEKTFEWNDHFSDPIVSYEATVEALGDDPIDAMPRRPIDAINEYVAARRKRAGSASFVPNP